MPQKLGDFKLLGPIGSGGMGVVYEAEQESVNRRVALKVLTRQGVYREEAQRLFQREALAGGRPQHPGIVTVYTAGEDQGFQYIAQELVEGGRTLADRLDGMRKTGRQDAGYFREAAETAACIADALEHAHASGVIHRDIKPSNILITPDGQPKVSDFGVARIEDALAQSRTGTFAGTPYYMSPEQAHGRRKTIDKRTDIFSLGVTLYEMLTLKRPFEGKTSLEVLKRIMVFEPRNPRQANPHVPRDLAVICLKALEKSPHRRYPSMAAFTADLRRYLSGDVIHARPAGPVAKTIRWTRRHPLRSTIFISGLSGLLLIAGYILLWSYPQARARIIRITRLADASIAEELVIEEKKLWPALSDMVPPMQQWIERAQDLKQRRHVHRKRFKTLSNLTLPADEKKEQSIRESFPEWKNLEYFRYHIGCVQQEIDAVDAGQAVLWISGFNDDEGHLYRERALWCRSKHEESIARLEKTLCCRHHWTFEDTEIAWEHDILLAMNRNLDLLFDENTGLFDRVQARLAFARTVEYESLIRYKATWEEAIRSIADTKECPQYQGLTITPQIGLAPIGRDPASGLWEFAHLQTGEVPERDEQGKLIYTAESGLVLVLIPGGSFRQGACLPDEAHPLGSPNVDPYAVNSEYPVRGVTLPPFFISKFEMTQGQWLRVTGKEPFIFQYLSLRDPFRCPTFYLSWNECARTLSRLDLKIPSESEWEYAARAGTDTIWWTGNEKESLQGAANLADLSRSRYQPMSPRGARSDNEDGWDDGYWMVSPVGSYRANAFGLHDVLGNITEWCRDDLVLYSDPKMPCDGTAFSSATELKAFRGGDYRCKATSIRCAGRDRYGPDYHHQRYGIRPARSLK